jgi:uroporphyrinogen III methyltransferase/synthase
MIKIGSRKSPLAMRQTEIVVEKLKATFPNEEFEIVGISTKGDKQLDKSLKSFGGKGVFIKELEAVLLDDEIQMAVHSAKDMPTELPEGLCISAAIERGAHEDMLVYCRDTKIDFETALKNITDKGDTKPIIGTGSARREIQIKEIFPNAKIKPIRGNIQTRLEKLKSGEYDAIILAKAAFERLAISDNKIKFAPLDFICAAGQGIIAVETKVDFEKKYTEAINDKNTFLALTAERAFLAAVGGGCHSPVGAYAVAENGEITMQTLQIRDSKIIRKKMSGSDAEKLARELAE